MPALFDQTVKSAVGFALASEADELPDEPGLYAWYLPFRGDTSQDLLYFLQSLQDNFARSTPATRVQGITKQSNIILERQTPGFALDSDTIQRLADQLTPSKVQQVAQLTLVLSLFAEPLYVGMTGSGKGIRGRIKEHLVSVNSFDHTPGWTGTFRTRVAATLRDKSFLRRCVIAYVSVEGLGLGKDGARLLEHILIRMVRPAQNIHS